ncbi:HAD family hydrolase [Cohnella sp. CBP 2801]|uniref:HAD family hydrolase n=2 Tax=Cohnella zeiphila TaxID=2761120 RepID=A0A7X0SU28_9BACL|nr:HAD family hydrolase [Cohnella zeiphila]
MPPLKAVLFDLDNTVLDRTAAFRRFVDVFLQTYFRHSDGAQELAARMAELDRDGYRDKRELFAELIEELAWERTPGLEELMDFYKKEYVNSAVPMERAQDVLRHVRGKYKTGLVTNGGTEVQHGKIDRLGIREDFDVILVSEEAGVKKPDPRIFAMATDRLGVRPEECVFVGDHPANDIEGAHRAGMRTIWLQVNQPWREGLSARPLRSIRRLAELLEVL